VNVPVRFTEAARWQLRAAVESVRRSDVPAARNLLEAVGRLARDGDLLEAEGAPLPEFPEMPHRAVRVGAYRLFFRRDATDLWIAGIWKSHTSGA
jgi:hypothetical protein